jgi:septal ring factor EnvC (AmiA/AmiB activator)
MTQERTMLEIVLSHKIMEAAVDAAKSRGDVFVLFMLGCITCVQMTWQMTALGNKIESLEKSMKEVVKETVKERMDSHEEKSKLRLEMVELKIKEAIMNSITPQFDELKKTLDKLKNKIENIQMQLNELRTKEARPSRMEMEMGMMVSRVQRSVQSIKEQTPQTPMLENAASTETNELESSG